MQDEKTPEVTEDEPTNPDHMAAAPSYGEDEGQDYDDN